MTQEDKQLLLKDLCARFPYGVIVERLYIPENNGFSCEMSSQVIELLKDDNWSIKPYLRPMSSMTEEEKKDMLQSLNIYGDIDNEGNLLLGVECNIITLKVCKKYLGELNKRMFDVCHMIEKGLAIEAPKGMYEIN